MIRMNYRMIYHLVKSRITKTKTTIPPMSLFVRKIHALLLFLLILPVALAAQQGIPDAPQPPRLVNDFANILEASQVLEMEARLLAINDSTGVQIAVVIVPTLNGYDPSDFSQRLGQKWGVGGKEFDNGFVILVKPKTVGEKGEAFIATGYGVEKFVPDATAWDIVNNEMIPLFKQNDYAGGINASITAIFKFVSGEYKATTYGKSKKGSSAVIIIIVIIIIIVLLFSNNNNNHHTITRGGGSAPIFFPWSGGGSSGGFGGFGGGGSSGGFGGFGGGGFGGGGAGGSW